jgi:hypothetical protein
MINRKILVYAGSAACLAGCASDFLSIFILGKEFPGYNQLSDTMSSLGSSVSPVSDIISAWWIFLGIMMVIFAFGFRAAYPPGDKYVKTVFWLLIIYGLGEGAGSGLFKADRVAGAYTTSLIIHDILGGAGVCAILIIPLIVQKIKPYFSGSGFKRYSYIVFILGTFFLVLFSFRYTGNKENIAGKYTGLWQRLFVLVNYIYIITIALMMAGRDLNHGQQTSFRVTSRLQ